MSIRDDLLKVIDSLDPLQQMLYDLTVRGYSNDGNVYLSKDWPIDHITTVDKWEFGVHVGKRFAVYAHPEAWAKVVGEVPQEVPE